METIFGGVGAKSPTQLLFIAMTFWNGLDYHNADERFNSTDDRPTLRKNLVNFSLVIPEIMRVEILTFGRYGKNWHIHSNISECRPTGPTFTKLSELVDTWMETINLTLDLQSSNGRCYGKLVILVANHRKLNNNASATLCENLVRFSLRQYNVYKKRQSSLCSLGGGISRHCINHYSVLSRSHSLGNDTAMLVQYSGVYEVQLCTTTASIGTQISLTTFVRGRHC